MPSSTMRTAVLQATALYALTMVLSHHLSGNMFEQVMENEGFQNMTNAWNKTMTLAATTNNTLEKQLTLDAGDTRNITLSINNNNINGTTANSTLSTTETPPESFYGRWLPREIVVFALISVLQYWWLIWLERILPARPRRKTVPHQQHEKVAESEDREEEVVKKWIAQGRVRRASLNWCNTFLKWVLEFSVGKLWYHTVEHVFRVLLKFQAPSTILQGLKSVSCPYLP